ncbi:hypothetical protein GCM10010435_74310 [Winogradskya consettensis]
MRGNAAGPVGWLLETPGPETGPRAAGSAAAESATAGPGLAGAETGRSKAHLPKPEEPAAVGREPVSLPAYQGEVSSAAGLAAGTGAEPGAGLAAGTGAEPGAGLAAGTETEPGAGLVVGTGAESGAGLVAGTGAEPGAGGARKSGAGQGRSSAGWACPSSLVAVGSICS